MAALSAIGQINIFNSLSLQAVGERIFPFGFGDDVWLKSLTVCACHDRRNDVCHLAGESISEYGIRGQGLSLVIFAGIVAQMPANLVSLLSDESTRWFMLLFTIVIIILTVFARRITLVGAVFLGTVAIMPFLLGLLLNAVYLWLVHKQDFSLFHPQVCSL